MLLIKHRIWYFSIQSLYQNSPRKFLLKQKKWMCCLTNQILTIVPNFKWTFTQNCFNPLKKKIQKSHRLIILINFLQIQTIKFSIMCTDLLSWHTHTHTIKIGYVYIYSTSIHHRYVYNIHISIDPINVWCPKRQLGVIVSSIIDVCGH